MFYSSPGSQRGHFLAPRSSRVGTGYTDTIVLGVKWVAVAPFEVKLGANGSHARSASVKPPPGTKNAQIRAKIIVGLRVGGMSRRRENKPWAYLNVET